MILIQGDETRDGAGDEINISTMKNDGSPLRRIEHHIGYDPQTSRRGVFEFENRNC